MNFQAICARAYKQDRHFYSCGKQMHYAFQGIRKLTSAGVRAATPVRDVHVVLLDIVLNLPKNSDHNKKTTKLPSFNS